MSESEQSVEERQVAALERIADEMEYQNAVLCEMLFAMDDLAARVDEHHHPESEPRDRSLRALQTDIADQLYERERAEKDGKFDFLVFDR
jgi:predicted component of type VI protein secretion system